MRLALQLRAMLSADFPDSEAGRDLFLNIECMRTSKVVRGLVTSLP